LLDRPQAAENSAADRQAIVPIVLIMLAIM